MSTLRPTVKGLVERDGEYLLLKQTFDDGHVWTLPGGGVDYGETQREALVREVREETTLGVEAGDPVGVYSFFWSHDGTDYQSVATVFEAWPDGDEDGDEVTVEENPVDEPIADHEWFDPVAVDDLRMDPALAALFDRLDL